METIYNTVLVPYLIAEQITDDRELQEKLINKAEVVYQNNDTFRKQLHSSKDERQYLKMFMEHWLLHFIKTENRNAMENKAMENKAMENNLRERIEGMVEKLEKRIIQLKQFAKEYEEEGVMESYYDCNIRSVQLQMVSHDLQTILNETK